MRLLLDTHCWLWFFLASRRLNEQATQLLSESDHEIFLSVASVWEMVIKHGTGKLSLPLPPGEYIPSRLKLLGHSDLPILRQHVLQLENLPPHHKDPFDRLLVAQAQVEDLHLVTADEQLKEYDVPLIWAGRGEG